MELMKIHKDRYLQRSKTMNLRVNNGVLEQMYEDVYTTSNRLVTDKTNTWMQVPQVELEQCYACVGTGESFTSDGRDGECAVCRGTGEVSSEYGDNA